MNRRRHFPSRTLIATAISDHQTALPILGWREWVALPELGLPALHAKVDTGAATSALFALDVERYIEAGLPWVRFTVNPLWPFTAPAVTCAARVIDERHVTTSSGHTEGRPVIRANLRLGLRVDAPAWPIELTLADRRAMQHPLLLGREAIAARVIVNAGTEYTLGAPSEPAILYS